MRKSLPLGEILSNHGTQEEREAYAKAVLACDCATCDSIAKTIKKRLKPKAERKPSTKRIDSATAKLIERYGKQQVIDSVGRWIAPEDRPTVSSGG